MTELTVALDAMGGDHGPSVVVPAAIISLQRWPNVNLVLVGDQTILERELARHGKSLDESQRARLSIHHTTEVVAMDEPPAIALRTKKDSSMRVAINLVKQGQAQACVSAGNTGALMATARFVLKTLPGIHRPAILSLIPTADENQPTRVLDLGANVDCTAEELCQFAIMASVVAQAADQIDNPRVALLNIGSEDIKGNEQVKTTAELLEHTDGVNYVGYVEGDDIFSGAVDVVVCDGFVGNVALKTSEGVAKLIAVYLKQAFSKNIFTKTAALVAMPVLKALRKKIDPSRYNGASFIGLGGIVIKSHGGANVLAYTQAINRAVLEVQEDVPEKISSRVAKLVASSPTQES